MAEEQEVSAPKRSPLMGYLVMGGLVVVVPLVLAGLVFQFVLKPVLMPEGEEEAHAEEEHHAEVADAYPVGALPVEFPDSQSAVLSDDPELAAPVLLGPGEFYVMGDHRSVSKDSRSFGPIQETQIVGEAVFRFWPLSLFGLVGWE